MKRCAVNLGGAFSCREVLQCILSSDCGVCVVTHNLSRAGSH